jgi:hypothetical protein
LSFQPGVNADVQTSCADFRHQLIPSMSEADVRTSPSQNIRCGSFVFASIRMRRARDFGVRRVVVEQAWRATDDHARSAA